MPGVVMETNSQLNTEIKELDVVALLDDAPEYNLARGQVGTVVQDLDEETVLVEFADARGAAYAIEAIPKIQLLPLIHESRAA